MCWEKGGERLRMKVRSNNYTIGTRRKINYMEYENM